MKRLALGLLAAAVAQGYPLDSVDTGISRLEGWRRQLATPGGKRLPPGALLDTAEVRLRLAEVPGADLTPEGRDPGLQKALDEMFLKRDASYSVVVADITDPRAIRWGAVRGDRKQLPGSVGKMLVVVGFLDALARAFPDLEARARVLRETVVVADGFAVGDSHEVPILDEKAGRNRSRPVRAGDSFNLNEWIDHALSASANAGGSVVWKEAMLLRHLGAAYPGTPEAREAFFKATPPGELTRRSLQVIEDPLRAAGLDPTQLRQGTMFTGGGQRKVPGVQSYASPWELTRLLLRIEQGRVVDAWSSEELKRFLYMTTKRIRYVFAPELAGAAVFFKSGSMYSCAPEPGFACGKFKGNRANFMNSVAIVESPARGPDQRRYLVAIMSNVLKVNSAWDHSRIGAAIDRVVRVREAVPIVDQGSEEVQQAAGQTESE